MKTTILITGGSGYLGRSLIKKLKNSYNLIVLLHKTRIKSSDFKILYGDINDPNAWEKSLPRVDVLVHLAGLTHSRNEDLYKKINIDGTSSIVNLAVRHKIKQFIYISTRAVGRDAGSYGYSKLLSEDVVKKSNLNYTILRVGEVYDENFDSPEGIGKLYKFIQKSIIVPYPSSDKIFLSPIHRDDVLKCIETCVGNRNTYFKTYTVCGPENLSVLQVLKRISNSQKVFRVFVPIPIVFLTVLYFATSTFFRITVPDQMKRLLCKKNSLSKEVKYDLKVVPRKFLI